VCWGELDASILPENAFHSFYVFTWEDQTCDTVCVFLENTFLQNKLVSSALEGTKQSIRTMCTKNIETIFRISAIAPVKKSILLKKNEKHV